MVRPGGDDLLPIETPLRIAAEGTFDLNGGNQQIASLADDATGGGAVTNGGDGASRLIGATVEVSVPVGRQETLISIVLAIG